MENFLFSSVPRIELIVSWLVWEELYPGYERWCWLLTELEIYKHYSTGLNTWLALFNIYNVRLHNDTEYMDIGYITNTWVSHDQGPDQEVISNITSPPLLNIGGVVIRVPRQETQKPHLGIGFYFIQVLRILWIEERDISQLRVIIIENIAVTPVLQD